MAGTSTPGGLNRSGSRVQLAPRDQVTRPVDETTGESNLGRPASREVTGGGTPAWISQDARGMPQNVRMTRLSIAAEPLIAHGEIPLNCLTCRIHGRLPVIGALLPVWTLAHSGAR
jgi:hypothetical protein